MPNQEPMIKVQDVRFRYDPEQPKYAVDGVSLDIRRGEFVAVLGANLLSLVKAISAGIDWAEVPMYLCGVAAAFVFGYLAIFALNRIVQRGKFGGFCYYCWGAGLLTLILSLIS